MILDRFFRKKSKITVNESSEISLVLDNYDDMFSDFDSSFYSKKTISDDFLAELKKLSIDSKASSFKIKLLVPSNLRDEKLENIIKKRIKDYFKSYYLNYKNEIKSIIKQGILFLIAGFIMLILNELLKNFSSLTLLRIVMDPTSWFLFWEGLDNIIFESKIKKSEFEFFDIMSKADIEFISY